MWHGHAYSHQHTNTHPDGDGHSDNHSNGYTIQALPTHHHEELRSLLLKLTPETGNDLPSNLPAFASLLDAQPPEVQEAFQFLLATAMHEE